MLIDAYTAVAASPRLSSVKVKAFGDESELNKPGANPRMIWVPTRDTFGPADTLGWAPAIVDGRRVQAHAILMRRAGCEIHLFTDYGPSGQTQMEDLIRELHNALHEELEAITMPGANEGGNYMITDAKWSPRSAISQKSIEVVQGLVVNVPLWSVDPAQLLGAVRTRL